ncbi:hypothetical protein JJC05_08815 [Flavobacterium davisii]|uniref:Uncharacterized protein n=2 Tax=Flavobacterium TaxID=237 RepID=A0A8G0P3P7_9FLAO|nr:hypothetical protein JJC05_08815 [Flavobacterium davisii]
MLNKVTVVELNSKSLLEINGGDRDNTGQTSGNDGQSTRACKTIYEIPFN